MIMDMSAQYSEFFCGLKQIGSDTGGILFSWSKVFGSNYAGVFAYYLSSPLSVLTLLCPNEKMPVGLLYLTVLKIGLCGLSFGILMNHMRPRRENRLSIVLFSVCYALMSYNIVYSMCLMWLDAVIWLPIVILGIEKIADGERSPLLFFSYTVLFLSTYYISYMVGVFSCIYFLFAYFRKRRSGVKPFFAAGGRFIMSAAGAGCVGAWLLLPTLYSLFEGKINGALSVSSGYNYEPANVLKKLFIGVYDSITNSGTPFFYCGMIVLVFYFAYYFTKTIGPVEKMMTALITFFLVLSTYVKELDLMWHVFQSPNWFPYRYSFLFTFFMIFTASKGFMRFREVPYAVYAVFFVLAATFYRYYSEGVGQEELRYSILFLFAAMCPLFIGVVWNRIRPCAAVSCVMTAVLLCVAAGETYINAGFLTRALDRAHRYESYEKYHAYKELTETLAQEAEEAAAGEFYRMGADFQRNFNESIGLGYAGISHYSSSYNRKINQFLHNMGFAQIYFWSSYAGSTTVTDALFSVKYVMSDPEIARMDDRGKIISWCRVPYAHYRTVASYESAVLYENPYVLPPCFAVSSRLKEFMWRANGVESQNYLLNCMLGDDASYFLKMDGDSSGAVTVRRTGSEAEYQIILPEGGPLYAYLPTNGNGVCRMQVDGEAEVRVYTGETDCIQYLGTYEAGTAVSVRISGNGVRTDGNAFYVLRPELFSKAVETLRAGGLQITDWGSGFLKGTADVKNDGVMFTSLVYDPSWHVLVDGVPAETWALQDGLLCFDIGAGTHEIEIRYRVPGFALGLALSVTYVTGASICLLLRFLRNRRRFTVARNGSVC